jgi:CheY-like chemotaxis protein/HPt (histidine-containing phosphotransfer) domain-containing protein
MPEMDGLELARAIRADPALAGIRLILLTSLGRWSQAARQGASTVDAYLTKPVRQSQLFDCLATVMGRSVSTERAAVVQTAVNPIPRVAGGTRLLVAEDNAVNQRIAVHMLEKLGYQADVVADGKEALEVLAQIPYPLVLMDCQMPQMDGYEATAAIRQRELGTDSHTAIIAMTASAMAGDRERCLAAGMDDYITKPVREYDLAAAIARWLPSATTPESQSPARAGTALEIDREVLAKIGDPAQGGDPAFLRDLVGIFNGEAPGIIKALREAAAALDSAALVRPAHTLKGNAGYLGAHRLGALCEQLESMGRAERAEGSAALVDELEREVAELQRVLEEESRRYLGPADAER